MRKQVLEQLPETYLLNRREESLLVLNGTKSAVIGLLKAIAWIVVAALKLLLGSVKLLLSLLGLVVRVFLIFAKLAAET